MAKKSKTGKKKKWYLYIVKCRDGSLYTGVTVDVKRRVREHNEADHSKCKYTRARVPVELVYSEEHPTKESAYKQESQIKKLPRTEKLCRISKDIKHTLNTPLKKPF